MAATVLKCTRLLSDNSEDSVGQDYKLTISDTQIFQVLIAEDTATPTEVKRAIYDTPLTSAEFALPRLMSVHQIDTAATCTRKRAQRVKGSGPEVRNLWLIQCDYSILPIGGETQNSKNIRVSVRGIEQTAYTQMSQGSPQKQILNAAKDIYPDPIEIALDDEIITVEFDSQGFNMSQAADARQTINGGTITMSIPQGNITFSRSFPKHTLRLRDVDYDIIVDTLDPTKNVWHVVIQLAYRKDTWDMKLPQKGFRWYVLNEDNGGNDTDDPNDPSSKHLTEWKEQAAYLDADGFKLADGAEIVATDPIQVYKEGNLAALIAAI